MKTIEESKALKEVWEWKDKAYEEVKNLDIKSALEKRLSDAIRTADLVQAKRPNKVA
jgi:predicted XRE-type DNA-binding protein